MSVARRGGAQSVHPRSCGEQRLVRWVPPLPTGSSPLVRGTGHRDHRRRRTCRFIPARAGNSQEQGPTRHQRAVHPRSCGEQTSSRHRNFSEDGSSPLVRGTVSLVPVMLAGERFIPARAGNRGVHLQPWPRSAVHPRSCGEQGNVICPRAVRSGSSPLVRGTAALGRVSVQHVRFIPARAGNSLAVGYWPSIIFTMSKNLPGGASLFRGGIAPASGRRNPPARDGCGRWCGSRNPARSGRARS